MGVGSFRCVLCATGGGGLKFGGKCVCFFVFFICLFSQAQKKHYTCFRFMPGSHAEHVWVVNKKDIHKSEKESYT